MPSPNTPRRRQPSWRRLVGGSLGLFFVVLAFLAGRMGAGADPALSDSKSETKKAAAQQSNSTSTSGTSSSYGATTSQPTDPNPPTTSAS